MKHPVEKIEWVKPETLTGNDYNPNHVAPPELALLKLSIMEDGWTQPIVVRADGEIVDGFHRWRLGLTDKEIRALSGGKVPVVRLTISDEAHQMMATIRHNRARGTHMVEPMAMIVRKIASRFKLPESEIMRRLGMEEEEVDRLLDAGGMIARGRAEGFANGWVPSDD